MNKRYYFYSASMRGQYFSYGIQKNINGVFSFSAVLTKYGPECKLIDFKEIDEEQYEQFIEDIKLHNLLIEEENIKYKETQKLHEQKIEDRKSKNRIKRFMNKLFRKEKYNDKIIEFPTKIKEETIVEDIKEKEEIIEKTSEESIENKSEEIIEESSSINNLIDFTSKKKEKENGC